MAVAVRAPRSPEKAMALMAIFSTALIALLMWGSTTVSVHHEGQDPLTRGGRWANARHHRGRMRRAYERPGVAGEAAWEARDGDGGGGDGGEYGGGGGGGGAGGEGARHRARDDDDDDDDRDRDLEHRREEVYDGRSHTQGDARRRGHRHGHHHHGHHDHARVFAGERTE
jgi:hypothetical protein